MKIFFLLKLLLVTLAASVAFGQPAAGLAGPQLAKNPSSYDDLLARLKSGDVRVDYNALRIAFSATDTASPYGSDRAARRTMNIAVIEKRYGDALKLAGEILKTTYLSPDAHVAASISHRELGSIKKAEFHKSVYLGLINSILAGADGKTPETAYRVISVEEEYAVIRALSISVWGQSFAHHGGHLVDVLSGTDEKTKTAVKVYFNMDIPRKLERRRLNPKN